MSADVVVAPEMTVEQAERITEQIAAAMEALAVDAAKGEDLKRKFPREWDELTGARPKRASVYFIQAGVGGPIKIGSAVDVDKRLAELQTGCPDLLRIIGTSAGGREAEFALHRKFSAHRIRGEWFYPCPELLATARGEAGNA